MTENHAKESQSIVNLIPALGDLQGFVDRLKGKLRDEQGRHRTTQQELLIAQEEILSLKDQNQLFASETAKILNEANERAVKAEQEAKTFKESYDNLTNQFVAQTEQLIVEQDSNKKLLAELQDMHSQASELKAKLVELESKVVIDNKEPEPQ